MGSSADHPRRPKGTPKTGGRRAGTPNRRTVGLQMGLVAAGAPSELATKPSRQQPLEFLLNVMDDETQSMSVRVDAAKSAAPYVHFRKGLVDSSGRDVPLTVHILRFSDVADELENTDRLAKSGPVVIEHDPSPTSH
jgi:hypothetical protein